MADIHDLFDMLDKETVEEFNKENEKLAKKNDEQKNSNSTKNSSKGNSKVTTKADAKTKDKPKSKTIDERIEEDCKKYTEIILKAFTEQIYSFKGEDIDNISLIKLQEDLVNLYGYGEFANGVKWQLVPNKDKTIGYLIATYNFYNKG